MFSKNRLITKPSRLTLGVGAVTVAAVAGIAIGTAAGPSTGTGVPAALNRAGGSTITSNSHSPYSNAIPSPAATAAKGAGKANGSRHVALDHRAAGHAAAATHHAGAPTAPAGHGAAHRAAAPAHHAAVAAHAAPYLMYDSVIPSAIPAGHAAAAYATGPYAASPSQLAGKGPVVWIDTIGSDPTASALDVEPGDATPSVAATWAYNRLSKHPDAVARIYTMISEWGAVKAAIAGLPHKMQSHIRWWIADPTGVAHLVPGSDATQWYWGSSYDISTATPRF